MEVGGQPHATAASTHEKEPVPTVQEAGWAPEPVWTGGNSRPHRDSIPDLDTYLKLWVRPNIDLQVRRITLQKNGNLPSRTMKPTFFKEYYILGG